METKKIEILIDPDGRIATCDICDNVILKGEDVIEYDDGLVCHIKDIKKFFFCSKCDEYNFDVNIKDHPNCSLEKVSKSLVLEDLQLSADDDYTYKEIRIKVGKK